MADAATTGNIQVEFSNFMEKSPYPSFADFIRERSHNQFHCSQSPLLHGRVPGNMSGSRPKEIVILGAGFGGVYTARFLGKKLPAEEARISIVNRENYW